MKYVLKLMVWASIVATTSVILEIALDWKIAVLLGIAQVTDNLLEQT